MQQILPHTVLLLLCLASRLVTSIHYMEDPESMHFVQSIADENFAFHGSPVFCFLIKGLYLITGTLSSAFALAGAASLFLIILFGCRILRVPLMSLEGLLLAFIIFFNPFIWLMSNRFMPDLLGAAVALSVFYFFVAGDFKPGNVKAGWLALGLLTGIKPEFLPLVLIPAASIFFKRKWTSVFWMISAILIWLVPSIMINGSEHLDWLKARPSGVSQIPGSFLQHIWADGLGGGWKDRHWILWPLSAGLILALFAGILIFKDFDYPKFKMKLAVASLALYAVWVFVLPDIFYYPRNFLPLLPFLCMILTYGIIFFLVNFNTLFVKIAVLGLLSGMAIQGISTAWAHRYPSALARIKEEIPGEKNDSLYIVTSELIREYLIVQKVKALYIDPDKEPEKLSDLKGRKVVVIGRHCHVPGEETVLRRELKHDPYINRTLPQISIYSNFDLGSRNKKDLPR